MNNELFEKAMGLFDTPAKWRAFCELTNQSESIRNRWWKTLQTEVYQREINTVNPEWDVLAEGNWHLKWHLKGDENKSGLCIHFNGDRFRVANLGALDAGKMSELFKLPKFNVIRTALDRIDGIDSYQIAWEDRNFSFEEHPGIFLDSRILSWFAGNRTASFADQLIRKVRKLQTPEITALFREINETCRKE